MKAEAQGAVRVIAPASLSNLGPGFDTFGLCISGIADEVEAERAATDGVKVGCVTGLDEGIPTDASNTAAVGAQLVLERSGKGGGLLLKLKKGIRIGSGIGGSAASAVAGAVAANEVLGRPLSKQEVLAAGLEAEQSAAGAIHGDNVIPCTLGGFILTTPGDPSLFQRYEVSEALQVSLLLPAVKVLTEEARTILPELVPLTDAVVTAAAAAHVVGALLAEDWPALGHAIMRDLLVEPERAKLIGFYSAVREAALKAGAYGCALSGSGPAMFAVSDSKDKAGRITHAMLDTLRAVGYDGSGRVVHADNRGVRVMTRE
jgi:homoserine kinase